MHPVNHTYIFLGGSGLGVLWWCKGERALKNTMLWKSSVHSKTQWNPRHFGYTMKHTRSRATQAQTVTLAAQHAHHSSCPHILQSCMHLFWALGLGVHGGKQAWPWEGNVWAWASPLWQQKADKGRSFRLRQAVHSSQEKYKLRHKLCLPVCVCCLPAVPPAPWPAASQKQGCQISAHQGWYLVIQPL